MRELLRAGLPAATCRAYLDAGWRDAADAVAWARTGVDPAQAAAYRSIGFTPAEASGLAESCQDAFGLVQRWWDAGIPRAEVPAWVMAGFSPDSTRGAWISQASSRSPARSTLQPGPLPASPCASSQRAVIASAIPAALSRGAAAARSRSQAKPCSSF